jgi:hypothetical protein
MPEHDPEKLKDFSGKIMRKNKRLERDDDSKISHPALSPTSKDGCTSTLAIAAKRGGSKICSLVAGGSAQSLTTGGDIPG